MPEQETPHRREDTQSKSYILHVFTGRDNEIVDWMSEEEFRAEGDFEPNRGQFVVQFRSEKDVKPWLALNDERYRLVDQLAQSEQSGIANLPRSRLP